MLSPTMMWPVIYIAAKQFSSTNVALLSVATWPSRLALVRGRENGNQKEGCSPSRQGSILYSRYALRLFKNAREKAKD